MTKPVTNTEAHMGILNELNALYSRKNHDYGDSFHQTWIEEGYAMSRIRLGDKLSRFKTLTRKLDSARLLKEQTTNPISVSTLDLEQQVADESIRDTLLDLANYAVMTIMEMDREKRIAEDSAL